MALASDSCLAVIAVSNLELISTTLISASSTLDFSCNEPINENKMS
jgi:hypothetical protein